jgi:8-amino-3,8-dideoxy-alpha-D-manno-octulosonate transaminase
MPPLGKGMAVLGAEERAAVLDVLESRSLFRYYGPSLLGKVADLESTVCDRFACGYAVAVSSGTAALRCALAALGVGCGDEVIVPAFTFIATVNAVVVAGAVPVFAEVDETLNLDPADVEARITDRTRAIIAVHLENVAADMDPLLEVASRRGVPVIEDAAQAIGTSYHGQSVGTLGAIGAFSLQLEKNITSGEGGLLTTDDEHLHVRAARYSDQGGQFVTSYASERGAELDQPFVGENLRMTEIAGAIARSQLDKLPGLLDALRANKARILKGIGDIDGMTPRRVPDPEGEGGSSAMWFLPDAETAKRFAAAVRAEGVPAAQMYRGRPVYATPSILEKRTVTGKGGPWNCAEHPTAVDYRMGMCPQTEALAARSILVAIGPGYTESDCDDVAEAVTKVAAAILAG